MAQAMRPMEAATRPHISDDKTPSRGHENIINIYQWPFADLVDDKGRLYKYVALRSPSKCMSRGGLDVSMKVPTSPSHRRPRKGWAMVLFGHHIYHFIKTAFNRLSQVPWWTDDIVTELDNTIKDRITWKEFKQWMIQRNLFHSDPLMYYRSDRLWYFDSDSEVERRTFLIVRFNAIECMDSSLLTIHPPIISYVKPYPQWRFLETKLSESAARPPIRQMTLHSYRHQLVEPHPRPAAKKKKIVTGAASAAMKSAAMKSAAMKSSTDAALMREMIETADASSPLLSVLSDVPDASVAPVVAPAVAPSVTPVVPSLRDVPPITTRCLSLTTVPNKRSRPLQSSGCTDNDTDDDNIKWKKRRKKVEDEDDNVDDDFIHHILRNDEHKTSDEDDDDIHNEIGSVVDADVNVSIYSTPSSRTLWASSAQAKSKRITNLAYLGDIDDDDTVSFFSCIGNATDGEVDGVTPLPIVSRSSILVSP